MPWRVYIDDSGTREYSPNAAYAVGTGPSRHFVYGAVLGEEQNTARLAAAWRGLKAGTFGTADVEIKSNWLRIEHERRDRYLTPFGITAERLTQFTESCYALISGSAVKLIGVVVDKADMQAQYARPWYAPTVAYEVLLQRVVLTVPASSDTIGVTVDDISGKTPNRSSYKELLQSHHAKLRRDGSRLLRAVAGASSLSFASLHPTVRFVNSAHSELVQIADLVAYCVHRQFRDHGPDWETLPAQPTTLPTYSYLNRIAGSFVCDGDGRVQGYGLVKVPLRQRVPWRVMRDKKDAAP